MKDKVIDIYDVKTWPADVLQYFSNFDGILTNQIFEAKEYDKVIEGLKPILSPYYLHGYHCTRLTEKEVNTILSNGMSLQNTDTLRYRIENLISDGTLQQRIAEQLLSSNQSNDSNRKHMLWFCFFPPYLAGQNGIERLFRSWGGEALYNSHESNPITGSVLNKIGNPCIIEALIPISGFSGYGFAINFADRYASYKSQQRPRNNYYEGCSTVNLPPNTILNIIKYPSEKFIELTQCDTWLPPL